MNELEKQVVEAQKEQVQKELATYKLHLAFKTEFWKGKLENASNKEQRETVAHQREKDIQPYQEKITMQEQYLQWLQSLDMESALEASTDDSSEEPSETSKS